MQRVFSFPLSGGLDVVTPPLAIKPGRLIACDNYEAVSTGGYRRIGGYERFSGLPKPSNAAYWYLSFDAGDIVDPGVGSKAHGATSGVTGEVLTVVLESGTWAGSDAAGYVVLFNVSGTFIDNEMITFIGASDGFDGGFSSGFG